MHLELNGLKKALTSLNDVLLCVQNKNFLQLAQPIQNGLKAGVIQNFEITYELCWKFMKRYLEHQLGSSYVDGVSRAELFRLSAEHHLIKNVNAWRKYHECRNLTSHTYDENIANDVFAASVEFAKDAKKFLQAIEERNDQD